MGPPYPTYTPDRPTLSKLDLHHLPDDKPVFACHKCSEVIVSRLTPGFTD